MNESSEPQQPELPLSIGDRLRQAREAAGLSTQEVADITRIPRRHVEAIEGNRPTALPSGPYAIGFARSIARAVGFPEDQAAAAMRAEMASRDGEWATPASDPYEPADSARIPPRALAWTAAIIGVLLVGGYMIWRTSSDAVPVTPTAEATAPAGPQNAASGSGNAAAAPGATALAGPLTIRATGDVWFGLNDPATGRLVFERTLRTGDSYAVPEEQRRLLLRTGRAQNLRLTVAGRELPPIGNPDVLVRDVALDAAALAARFSATPASPPAPAAATPAP